MRIIQATISALLIVLIGAGTSFADDGSSSSSQVNLLSAVPAPILAAAMTSDVEPIDPASQSGISDFMATAFENSPMIAAARANWQAIVDLYPQATSWPDPTADFKWVTETGSYEAQLMQMIPNPRQTDLQGDIVLSNAEIGRLSYEKTVRDVMVNVMRSYYELGYLGRAIQIAKENKDLFAQIVEVANLGYAQNTVELSEKSIAESRLAQSDYEYLLLQEQLFTEQANMRSILGVSADTNIADVILPDADSVQLDLDQVRTQVSLNRQELAIAGLSVEAANDNVSLSRAMASPDFSLGLMYESMAGQPMATDEMGNPVGSSRDNTLAIMFGFTIPIWGDKNHARVAQAQAELEAAQAEQARQFNEATASADRIYYQIQNLDRLIVLYRDSLIPQAALATDLAQTWYESGESSFNDLVESRLVLGNFELAGARAQADYLIALSELQRLAGVPVENLQNPVVEIPEAAQ
ncbi:MAG: TolC family protein [bacterium]|nr:TolC family protein [bacterium]